MKVRARSSAAMRAGAIMTSLPSSGFCSIESSRRLFLERVVDDLLDRCNHVHPPGGRILHDDEKHVLGAVDHQIDAGGAVPFDLSKRARRRRHRGAGLGADAEAVAEPEAVARIIEIVAG